MSCVVKRQKHCFLQQQCWNKRRKSINTSLFARLLSTRVEKEEEQGQSQETQAVPAPPTPVAKGRVTEAGVPLHSPQPGNWTKICLYTGEQRIWIYVIYREEDKSTRLQRSQKLCGKCVLGSMPQSTYIYRVQSSVWRLPNYWPPTPSPPSECVPRTKGGGIHTRRVVRGWGVNISEDAIGLASYSIIPLRAMPSKNSDINDI